MLRSTTSITTLTLWGHYYGKYGLSEHKNCHNVATSANSKNAKRRIKASSAGKCGYGDKGR
jgi:hypothetical protein